MNTTNEGMRIELPGGVRYRWTVHGWLRGWERVYGDREDTCDDEDVYAAPELSNGEDSLSHEERAEVRRTIHAEAKEVREEITSAYPLVREDKAVALLLSKEALKYDTYGTCDA